MLVYPLTTPGIDPKFAGTKGATLALLHKASIPMPFTLIISAEAFKRYFKFTELDLRVREVVPAPLPSDRLELARISKEAQFLFQDTPLPDYLEDELTANMSAFDSAPAMVRSSFINETEHDLPPGIFDHAGKAQGHASIIRSIRTVWASLYSVNALSAFADAGIDPVACTMAVIVQRYVPAIGFGHVHTIHPVTGARDTMMVAFEEHISGHQAMHPAVEWTIDRDRSSGKSNIKLSDLNSPLPARNIEDLFDISKEIEKIFHLPAKIEFALTKKVRGKLENGNGKLYILQAEPMRDIPPAPIEWNPPEDNMIYQRGGLSAALHYPVTPLFSTLGIQSLNRGGAPENNERSPYELTTINGWVYTCSPFSTNPAPTLIQAWMSMLLGSFNKPDERSAKAVLELRKMVALETDQRLAQLSGIELLDLCRRLMYYTADMLRVFQQSTYLSAGVSATIFNAMFYLMTSDEDPEAIQLLCPASSMPRHVEQSAHWVADRIKDDKLRKIITKRSPYDLSNAFLTGIPPISTLESEWRQFSADLTSALKDNASIAFDLDFSQPTLEEAPWVFISMIQAILESQLRHPNEREMDVQQLRESTFSKFEVGWTRFFAPFARQAYDWAKNSAEAREESLSAISASYPLLRQALLRIGELFVDGELLDDPGSIFWLYENEIEEILTDKARWHLRSSFTEIVALRKQDWNEFLTFNPPSFLPADHWLAKTFHREEPIATLLRGASFSRGMATGPVRLIRGMEDLRALQPGEIVVAASLNSGWNLILHKAAAIVCESSGTYSFSSTLARQTGVPCVVAVRGASKILRTGQLVRVDGTSGTIQVES